MIAKSRKLAGKPGAKPAAHRRKAIFGANRNDADVKRAAERAIMENLTVPIPVAGKALGMGRNKSYQAAKTGELSCVGTGKKRACPTAPIRQQLGLENPATA